eukprot:107502_1
MTTSESDKENSMVECESNWPDNLNDVMKKNIDKIISYYQRSLEIENEICLEIIKIIYHYQQMIDFYQLSIPVTHSCVQSFEFDFNKNEILIQIASLFFIFNTETLQDNGISRLFQGIQRLYNYHCIHIPN